MSPVSRIWIGLLALGAGLVHLAMVSGAPPVVAAPLIALGALEFVWGVACFARGTPPLPRVAIVGALLPVLVWGVALLVSTATAAQTVLDALRPYPLATASAFDIAAAVGVALWMRRGRRPERPDPAPLRLLVAVGAGAALVAVLATPALAATRAGDFAPAHHFGPTHSHER